MSNGPANGPLSTEPYAITQAHLDPTSQNRPGPCDGDLCWQGVEGIVIHRTASPTMNAWAIRQYFNDAPDGRYASSQFVLDNNVILQLMPVGEIAYHTAGKNLTHLGIETCEHNWSTSTWQETYNKLVWLTGYLMRTYDLTIDKVSGHFAWDKVNRPYDPTHPGWIEGDSQATGLFNWNRFTFDLIREVDRATTVHVPVRVVRATAVECTTGRLIDAATWVPLRAYTTCATPDASITWNEAEQRVTVTLPPKYWR